MTDGLWKLDVSDAARWAVGPVDVGPRALIPPAFRLDEALSLGAAPLFDALPDPTEEVPDGAVISAPLESQEVWAAGVTYLRSRDARKEESADPDHYARVYEADRPELFLKAAPHRTRGPGEKIGIREDSTWDVPEPELAVLLDASGRTAAYAVGNDVSSRSIEGANPLYLPQAKVYDGSCAVGPCLVSPLDLTLANSAIDLRIHRNGALVFDGSVSTGNLRRLPDDLASWLFRAQRFPVGVLLLTGTGVVPDSSFTLRQDDRVEVAITGLGCLVNTVATVVDQRQQR